MQSFNDLADMRISLAQKVRAESSDTGGDTTLIRWMPVVVPLVALLPTLAAYFIGWGVLAGTH